MCAWETGLQKPRKNTLVSNKEILEKKGFLDEREAKLLFYQFLRNNISFSASLLMGIDLFPFQHIGINSMLKSDYSLCVWSRGLSKCTHINSLVSTNYGTKRVGDVNVGDKILAKNGYCLVEDKVVNEEQKTYKVTSQKGYESEGLDYHRVLVLNKDLTQTWKFSKDLSIGDCLIMRKNAEFPEQIDIFDGFVDFSDNRSTNVINPKGASLANWYYFFGLFMGDGHFGDKCVKITSADQEIGDFLYEFASSIGIRIHAYCKKDALAKDYTMASKSLKSFLIHCGFVPRTKAFKKTIPVKLLQASKDNLCLLLRGFFDTDGYVATPKTRRNTHIATIGFTSSSYDLIKQIRFLLLQLGIVSKTGVTFKGGDMKFGDKIYQCNKAWSIIITSYDNTSAFAKNIGFLIKRKQALLDVIKAAKYVSGEFSEYIPYIGEYLISKMNKKSICLGKQKGGIKLNFRKNTSKRLGAELVKYVDEDSAAKINALLGPNLFFDTVAKIEEGSAVTVDLQVQEEHCYVSDGFINHNSFSAGICAGLDAMFSQGINIGILSSSYRQCLEENEYVLCESGLKKIKEVSVGEKLFAKDGLQEIKNKWVNEKSDGIEIKTKKCYSLKGKREHRILTYNEDLMIFEYKEIKDLKIGDHVPISCNEKSNGSDLISNLDVLKRDHHCIKHLVGLKDCEEFYYFMGQMLGDGYFGKSSHNTRFNLTTADQETIDYVSSYISSILPNNSISIRRKVGSLCMEMCFSSSVLCDVFEDLGYKANTTATFKEIPEKIFLAKKEYIASFIRGLIDSDGHIGLQGEVCLNTSSKKLAKQFQLLLLTFGIVSGITTEPARGEMEIMGVKCIGRESYKVRITNYYNLNLFYNKIGCRLSRKQNKLAEYLAGCKRTTNEFVVPKLGAIIHEKYRKKNIKHGIKRSNFKGNANKYSIKKALKIGFLNKEDHDLLKSIAETDFYFDKVTEIREVEDIITYDIEVDNEHCYWGNGFINHNSKMIFKKIEDIAAKPEAYLFRQAISKIRHSNDCWELEIGRSRITALPLGDGEKLRGYRFNRIYIDEFLLMPERVITEILSPFLAVVQEPQKRKEIYDLESKLIARGEMKEEDRHQFESNKLIALSSASYKFEYLYKLYQQYENLILNPKPDNNAKRCIIQLSYDCAPDHLYDQNQIDQAKATMSEAQFQREYGAQFTSESDGFFSQSKISACTVPDGETPSVEAQGDPNEEYIVSVDPSWAETSTSDDFAIQILKINKEKQITTLVHSYAIPGGALKEHISYFYYIISNFNVVAMCFDYSGGLTFMKACNESELFKFNKIELKIIEVEFDKPEDYNANLISAKNEYNKSNHKTVFMRKATSAWIRVANEQLQSSLDHKRIFFASPALDGQFRLQTMKNIDIFDLKYRRKTAEEESLDEVDWEEGAKRTSSMIDFLEHIHDMIRLTKTQLTMIVPTTSVQGTQSFDLPKNLKGSGRDRARKDSYSALVLGNWISKIYFDMQTINVEETDSTFTPMMI